MNNFGKLEEEEVTKTNDIDEKINENKLKIENKIEENVNNQNVIKTEVLNVNQHKDNSIIGVILPKKKRIELFIVLALTNILLNMDHGTIPAATNEIMKELSIEEALLGTLGSLVYVGVLIGSFSLIKLIDITNRKKLCFLTTIFNGLLIWSFTKVNNIPFLFINRIFVGVCQAYVSIYFPVWIDQYGMKSWKTSMMAVFNITSPLGVIVGFILTMTVKLNLSVSFNLKLVESIIYNTSSNYYYNIIWIS